MRAVMLRHECVPRCAAVVLAVSLGFAAPVLAQDDPPGDVHARSGPLQDAVVAAVQADVAAAAAPVPAAAARADRRPPALVPLYIGFGVLQALDIHSTARALGHGAAEANPLMKGIAGNTAELLAVKAGAGAAAIYASEKMWRRNRTAAVIFMVAANSGMVWVVQHNYRAGR